MYIKTYNKGFTLIELMVSILIMGILMGISVTVGASTYRDFQFNSYASKLEYFAKYARIHSIKKSVYTGLCIQGKVLTLRDMGANQNNSTDTCDSTKTTVIKTLDMSSEKYITVGATDATNFIYDARGIAYNQDNICLSNGGKYVKYQVKLVGIITTRGASTCP
ncbi:MAG: prepilin-type N-terminal cleavage/methylation domain-containing protein [Candidatus Sericytochromatia bacterium]|nr:prepilin-type N-terminal cleavage/methylation domain-containing protein [Candidatus Sericytochromatia bacterium]